MAVNKKQCSERVAPPGQWGSFQQHQCNKKAVVEREGKAYCKIHDPEYIKTKNEKRQAKYEAGNCKQCGHHFSYPFHKYCPLCGTKRVK